MLTIFILQTGVFSTSQDVLNWRDEVEYDKEVKADAEIDTLCDQITTAMTKMGINYDVHSNNAGGQMGPVQEFDFNGYQGPYGRASRRRFVSHGTVGLLSYARDNRDKFEAYGEFLEPYFVTDE